MLSSITDRGAKWYYYSALANSGLGNTAAALEHARTAARLEPNNPQYAELLERMQTGGAYYSPFGGYRQRAGIQLLRRVRPPVPRRARSADGVHVYAVLLPVGGRIPHCFCCLPQPLSLTSFASSPLRGAGNTP